MIYGYSLAKINYPVKAGNHPLIDTPLIPSVLTNSLNLALIELIQPKNDILSHFTG